MPKKKLKAIYKKLEKSYGDLGWWPGDTPFEVMVGAILTQNTAWSNVEKAIGALKSQGIMTPNKILGLKKTTLEGLIRSSGFFKQKAERLIALSEFLIDECDGNISKLKRRDADTLREKLLEIKGIGPETADSILLYALDKPVFVIDTYTKRIFSRHGLTEADIAYKDLQEFIYSSLEESLGVFNKFHAYIVETGKRYCKKKKPLCEECPINNM